MWFAQQLRLWQRFLVALNRYANSLDEAVALPSEFSSRIARNTQLILQEETNITKVVDPWGGSYMMESLTEEMYQEAKKIVDEVSRRWNV